MVLKGNVAIRARRKKVWDFLTNRNQTGECVPGMEKIENGEPNKKYREIYSGSLRSVKVCFDGDVDVRHKVEPYPARLKTHGTVIGNADLLIEAFS